MGTRKLNIPNYQVNCRFCDDLFRPTSPANVTCQKAACQERRRLRQRAQSGFHNCKVRLVPEARPCLVCDKPTRLPHQVCCVAHYEVVFLEYVRTGAWPTEPRDMAGNPRGAPVEERQEPAPRPAPEKRKQSEEQEPVRKLTPRPVKNDEVVIYAEGLGLSPLTAPMEFCCGVDDSTERTCAATC